MPNGIAKRCEERIGMPNGSKNAVKSGSGCQMAVKTQRTADWGALACWLFAAIAREDRACAVLRNSLRSDSPRAAQARSSLAGGGWGLTSFFGGEGFCAGDWFLLPVLLGFAGYGLILIDRSAVKIIRVARLLFRV